MQSIFSRMAELRAEGRRFALATVVRTHGSTPQIAGAKLILDDLGRAAGTLGGGCVEADAIGAVKDILANGGRSLRAYELTEELAWNTGLVCGGTMWILAEPIDDAVGPFLDDLASASTGGTPMAVVTRLKRDASGLTFAGRGFVDATGKLTGTFGDAGVDARITAAAVEHLPHGTARSIRLDDEHDVMIDAVASRPRVIVAGGGHVALAIARQARLVDFDVTILEDRPEFADPLRFDGAEVIQGDVPAALATLDYGWNSFVVIATRGHKLDADCVRSAVKTRARYIGLLGSRRKTVLIEEMLRDEAVDDARIRTIRAPVGLDLGGRTPAEIALSVMAEITQVRYQASGKSLSITER